MTERAELLRQLAIPSNEREARGNPWPWIFGAITIVVLGYFGWRFLMQADSAPLVNVVTAVSAEQTSSNDAILEGSGYVVARRQATVSAKTTGKLLEVLLEEGMEVQAGQVLARLEPENIQRQLSLATAQMVSSRARVRESEIALVQAERELVRQRELMKRKLVSQQALDLALSEVESLRARVASARSEIAVANASVEIYNQELDDLTVRAPFAGVVIAKAAQPGEIVSPISAGGGFTRTGIGTIVDMNSLEVEIDVSESNIQKVFADQPAEILLNAYPDSVIAGKVIAIIPTADRTKATVKVRVGFVVRDKRALPDMGARVKFLADSTLGVPIVGVLLPSTAVIDGHVFAIDGATLKQRSVKVSQQMGSSVRIEQGVSAGERFATPNEGAIFTDGMTVRTQ